MNFELVYKTNHRYNQKLEFLKKLETHDNKYIYVNDILYVSFDFVNFKHTIDKFFIVSVHANFEYYIKETSTSEQIEIIKNYFPEYLKLNIIQ